MKLKPGQYSPVITVQDPVSKRIVGIPHRESCWRRNPPDSANSAIRVCSRPSGPQLRDRREQLLKAAYYEVLRDTAKVDNYFADDSSEGHGSSEIAPSIAMIG